MMKNKMKGSAWAVLLNPGVLQVIILFVGLLVLLGFLAFSSTLLIRVIGVALLIVGLMLATKSKGRAVQSYIFVGLGLLMVLLPFFAQGLGQSTLSIVGLN